MLEAYDFEIAAAVESGPELTRALAELEPDVAVVDVRLPPSHTDEGLQCALAARRARPGLPVLVLSQHVEQLYARELLADGNGGVGYLLKDRVFDAEQFIDAVRRVAAGGTAMDPQVIQQLLSRRAAGRPADGRADPARAGGDGADGAGPFQRGDRGPAGGHGAGDRQAHVQHLREARACRCRTTTTAGYWRCWPISTGADSTAARTLPSAVRLPFGMPDLTVELSTNSQVRLNTP